MLTVRTPTPSRAAKSRMLSLNASRSSFASKPVQRLTVIICTTPSQPGKIARSVVRIGVPGVHHQDIRRPFPPDRAPTQAFSRPQGRDVRAAHPVIPPARPERTHARQAVLTPPGVNATRPGPGCRSDIPPITKGLRHVHGKPDPATPPRPPCDSDQRDRWARSSPQRPRHRSRARRRRRPLHRDVRTADRRSSHGDPTGTAVPGLCGSTTPPLDQPDPTLAPSPTRCGHTPAAPAPPDRPHTAAVRATDSNPGDETMTSWYVASLADGQTHLANRSTDGLVTARCDGRQFRPLAALTGTPPDQEQICPACRSGQSPKE